MRQSIAWYTSMLLCAILIALAPPGPAFGQPAPLRNGATWYQRAFDRLPTITEADWEDIWAWQEHPNQPPPPGLREVLAKAQPILNNFRRGARQAESNFNLEYGRGIAMPLPHLASMRSIAKLMKADIHLTLHDGDSAGAADRIGALYQAGGQLKSDRTVISTLVGMAIFNFADATAQDGFDHAAFTANDADILYDSLATLDERDPFGAVEAIMMEQSMMVEWMTDRFADPEKRHELLGMVSIMDGNVENEQAHAIMTLDEEGFLREVEQYDQMMDRMVEAFLMDDPEVAKAMLTEIDGEFDRGEAGLIAGMITPALGKLYERLQQVKKQLADRKAMLDELRTGRTAPMEHANAATWYEAAIASLRTMKPKQLDLLIAYAAQPGESSDEIDAALTQAAEALEAMQTAGRVVRCDFAYLRPYRSPALCPEYVAGMHDVLRVLEASAIHRMRAGETEAALNQIDTLCRAIAHLSSDQVIMSARVAHRAFNRADALIGDAMERGSFSDERKEQLFAAIDRIPRSDPFGYIGGYTSARDWLATYFQGQAVTTLINERADEEGIEARAQTESDRVSALVRTWTADEVFLALATLDAMGRADRARAITQAHPDHPAGGEDASELIAIDPLDRVNDLIAPEPFERLRAALPELEPLIRRGEPDVISRIPLPPLAYLNQSMERARRDLRDGLRRLRPDEEAATATAGE